MFEAIKGLFRDPKVKDKLENNQYFALYDPEMLSAAQREFLMKHAGETVTVTLVKQPDGSFVIRLPNSSGSDTKSE